MIRMVERFNEVRQENYDWYSVYQAVLSKERIDFMLNDFRYKNEVRRYRENGVMKHLKYAIAYRAEAIACYAKIATLLNKPEVHKSFYPEASITDRLVGEYNVKVDVSLGKYFLSESLIEEDTKFKVVLFKEDNRLYRKFKNSRKRELIYLSDSLFVSDHPYFHNVEIKDDEIVLKENYGWVYRKLRDDN